MPSSVIADFDYDAEQAQLTVSFVSGRAYRYFLVPANVVVDFRAAESKGAFFNRHVRDRFPCREVTARVA